NVQSGRGSWFGDQPGWSDPKETRTASGAPLSVPGIALPQRATLGQRFNVTDPTGRTFNLPQTDVGPAASTGRGIDINSAAAQKMGYTPQTFPTDAKFAWAADLKSAGFSDQQAQQSRQVAQQTFVGTSPQQAGRMGVGDL